MTVESTLQAKGMKRLRKAGFEVIKINSGPGVPTGTEDTIILYEGFWAMIEWKSSKTAKFQPLQKEKIKKHDEWSWSRAVYPENYEKTMLELEAII